MLNETNPQNRDNEELSGDQNSGEAGNDLFAPIMFGMGCFFWLFWAFISFAVAYTGKWADMGDLSRGCFGCFGLYLVFFPMLVIGYILYLILKKLSK